MGYPMIFTLQKLAFIQRFIIHDYYQTFRLIDFIFSRIDCDKGRV